MEKVENELVNEFISEQDKSIDNHLKGISEKLRSMFIELVFIGMLYLNPVLIRKFEKSINSKFDFTTEAVRFFYEQLLEIVQLNNYKVNEYTVNSYMVDNSERLKQYQTFGGYKWIEFCINMAEENNAVQQSEIWYNNLKRYTVTRSLWLYGFKEISEKMVDLKSFQKTEPRHIRKYVINEINRIYVNVTADNTCHTLTEQCEEYVNKCINIPQRGVDMVFPVLSKVFNGFRLGHFSAWGMLSNSGKTRFMIRAIENLALKQGKKCCIISNEMSEDEMRVCLITTVINNEDLQELHGIKINKSEREIQNGIYRADEAFKNEMGVNEQGIVVRLTDE